MSSFDYYNKLRGLEIDSLKRDKLERMIRYEDLSFSDRVRELTPAVGDEFALDPATVDWTPLDHKLTALSEIYLQSCTLRRSFIRSTITRDQGWLLILYSHRMAVFGVRAKSEEFIRDGLVAQAIENLAVGDVRDNLVALTLLFDAAIRSGLDPARLFRHAADISGMAMSSVLTDYLKRERHLQTPECMGFQLVNTSLGATYRSLA
jgi:hypothetical protein